MRNFNPIFNSINATRNITPFASAGSSFVNRTATNGLFARSLTNRFSLSSMLTGAQKTIGTINQIVPIYNQVKPMISNSKALINIANNFRKTNFKSKRYSNATTIDITPKETKIKEDTQNKTIKKEGNIPSKPFFA